MTVNPVLYNTVGATFKCNIGTNVTIHSFIFKPTLAETEGQ